MQLFGLILAPLNTTRSAKNGLTPIMKPTVIKQETPDCQ